jgi:histidinol-phosphate aminotransferase
MSAEKRVSEYALPHVKRLHAYTPGFQPTGEGWVKINTNENPYSPSPMVEEAIKGAMGDDLRLYPDPLSWGVREEVAQLHELDAKNVIVGNGSDDVLNLLVRAFSTKKESVGFTVPSYSLYPVLCGIQNSSTVEVPFDRSMELPLEAIVKNRSRILFFTSPNAPTGVGFSNESLRALLGTFDGIVVVDEAYADFAQENAVELLGEFSNLVITRTLSKSYALAGLRVGYGLASPEVIEALDRVRDSYNVNRLSQAGAIAALKDQSYMKAIARKVARTRDFYYSEFTDLGWFTYQSEANMLFTEPVNRAGESGPAVTVELFEYLKDRKILVRYFPGHTLTESFLRISVGDEDQMLKLSETIEQWLKNA